MEPNRCVSEWIFTNPRIDPVSKGTIVPLVRAKENRIAQLETELADAIKNKEIYKRGAEGQAKRIRELRSIDSCHMIERDRLRGRIWELIRIGRVHRQQKESLQSSNRELLSYKKEVEAVAEIMFEFTLERMKRK